MVLYCLLDKCSDYLCPAVVTNLWKMFDEAFVKHDRGYFFPPENELLLKCAHNVLQKGSSVLLRMVCIISQPSPNKENFCFTIFTSLANDFLGNYWYVSTVGSINAGMQHMKWKYWCAWKWNLQGNALFHAVVDLRLQASKNETWYEIEGQEVHVHRWLF